MQKITFAENLRPRAFDDLAIELNINCNRKKCGSYFFNITKLCRLRRITKPYK
nr:MAG TPA: hypothetical protein [Caudoviricetes sp.]